MRDRNDLIEGLLKRGDADPNVRATLHLLAAACLDTAVQRDDALQADVDRRLQLLVPPQDSSERRRSSPRRPGRALPSLQALESLRLMATRFKAAGRTALAGIGPLRR